MEQTIIKQIQPMLPQILSLSKRKKSIWFDYDKEADVLYISFQKPQQAADTEIVNDDILVRRKKKDVVGITIMHASDYK